MIRTEMLSKKRFLGTSVQGTESYGSNRAISTSTRIEKGKMMAREGMLLDDGRVASALWIDQDNALDQLDERVNRSIIPRSRAADVANFIQNGFVVLRPGHDEALLDRAVEDVETLWARRPDDLLGAHGSQNGGRPQPVSLFPEEFRTQPGCRLLDAHSHSQSLAKLVADAHVMSFIEMMMEEEPVATQSLYFSYGSNQSLHRDPWFVVTTPIANLFASWLALEDVTAKAGPLRYVPGSHRLPYSPLNTGDIVFHDPSVRQDEREAHIHKMHEGIRDSGLVVEEFLPQKGEVLIWHSSLVHGGAPVSDSAASRNSFVVHYDAMSSHPRHAQSVNVGGERTVVSTTETLREGRYAYFANPYSRNENG